MYIKLWYKKNNISQEQDRFDLKLGNNRLRLIEPFKGRLRVTIEHNGVGKTYICDYLAASVPAESSGAIDESTLKKFKDMLKSQEQVNKDLTKIWDFKPRKRHV